MSGRHTADAAHPAPTVWGMPRNRPALPVKHLTETQLIELHQHTFEMVAEFTGRRASLEQCLAKLPDGTVCHQTQTRWAR